ARDGRPSCGREPRPAPAPHRARQAVGDGTLASGERTVAVPAAARGSKSMIALQYSRSVPRYAASRAVGRAAPGLLPRVAPLRLGHIDDPALPNDEWVRVSPLLS